MYRYAESSTNTPLVQGRKLPWSKIDWQVYGEIGSRDDLSVLIESSVLRAGGYASQHQRHIGGRDSLGRILVRVDTIGMHLRLLRPISGVQPSGTRYAIVDLAFVTLEIDHQQVIYSPRKLHHSLPYVRVNTTFVGQAFIPFDKASPTKGALLSNGQD